TVPPTPVTPVDRSTPTAKAVVAQLASRPDTSALVQPAAETVRVTPRATTAVGSSDGSRNGNGPSTTGF
ncbi:MAG: hypothetical protein ACC726_10195, partial [Chloroflexota bacterium]